MYRADARLVRGVEGPAQAICDMVTDAPVPPPVPLVSRRPGYRRRLRPLADVHGRDARLHVGARISDRRRGHRYRALGASVLLAARPGPAVPRRPGGTVLRRNLWPSRR